MKNIASISIKHFGLAREKLFLFIVPVITVLYTGVHSIYCKRVYTWTNVKDSYGSNNNRENPEEELDCIFVAYKHGEWKSPVQEEISSNMLHNIFNWHGWKDGRRY